MKRKQRLSDELIALMWVMLLMVLGAMIGGVFLLPLFTE